jgi:parvulin-like peptidyl-prolyl isomerase
VNRLALLVLTLAFATAGCSPKSAPIIEVGNQVVTVADYERAARNNGQQYLGAPAAAKAEFVSDLRRRALLLEQAHRLGYDTSAVLVNATRDEERRQLMQALYTKLAPQKQPVSDAEIRALHEARKEESHVHLIYTSQRETAVAAKARARSGEPFAQVARTYSITGVLPADGDVGWLAPGAMPNPLDEALRRQVVGEVGGPYETRDGFFLMRVSERRKVDRGELESQRAALTELARQRKQQAAFNHAYLNLKQEYAMKPAPGGAQLLFRAINPVSPLTPTPEMRATPLASYQGGSYTLGDALTEMSSGEVQPPPYHLLPGIEIWIEAQVMRRVAFLEARRRHLEEDPAIAASLKARREQMLMEGVYSLAVAAVPPPGPELVAMAWERVKSQFVQLQSAHIAVYTTHDSATAMTVARMDKLSGSLAEAVRRMNPAEKVQELDIKYPNPDPAWQVFTAMFTQQQPGAVFGPEKRANDWRIVQLLDKTMAQLQWEDLPDAVRQNISGSAAELARDQRFKVFTDSLATAFKPRMNEDRIAKLPWPILPSEASANADQGVPTR